jgi:UDP-N-acetylglucosamine 2-epimerase
MYDTLLYAQQIADGNCNILQSLKINKGGYCLVTIHRAENTDNVDNLRQIIQALGKFDERVIFPIHPRTQKVISTNNIPIAANVVIIPSIGYLDFVVLEANAKLILTDSGGVQREAYCLKVPCITVFPSTSWVETVEDGWNKLVDADVESILSAYQSPYDLNNYRAYFGDGNAAEKTIDIIRSII